MKKEEPFVTFDDILGENKNKYQAIVEIASEIKKRLEFSDIRDNSLIFKVLEEFKNKKAST
ncbi:MAG: hypothetical protein HY769_09320 [Candidatus Stahlbacteria bacterium]|nr:hypothetical protein [Candidatus Stahlbacteria bacterium]